MQGVSPGSFNYYQYYSTFDYWPTQIYDYFYFVYTPAFLIQFFWIKLVSFQIGLILWMILNIICITLVWMIILNDERFNVLDKSLFFSLVIIYAWYCLIITCNTDGILAFCSFFSYYFITLSKKVQFKMISEDKMEKFETFCNFFAGILFAFASFKPTVLIWAPLLFIKSKKKIAFSSGFLIWIIGFNFLFLQHPDLIMIFLEKVKNGQEFAPDAYYYQNDILNYIWRLNISNPRHQTYIYPALVLYSKNIVKREKIHNYLNGIYVCGYILFNVFGYVLYNLGF